MTQIIQVVGLGFGDEGKGSIVDYLVRKHDAKLVVRFNGGAQAAHNVVTPDGLHHCFSQFGSGTLVPGVRTHLSQHVLVNPITLVNEEQQLQRLGITDAFERLTIDERCLIINPFQVMANRCRENARGAARHGSCGMGIGETVADAIFDPDSALRLGDLIDPDVRTMRHKLKISLYRKLGEFGSEQFSLDFEDVFERLRQIGASRHLYPSPVSLHAMCEQAGTTIFEGAQGVLLDEDYGFAPHTTWTKTTLQNADELLADFPQSDLAVRKIGVLRCYMTRHGAGPFVTELPSWSNPACPAGEHNGHGFQGGFRVGTLDLVALGYAAERCPVDELAVTCLDHLDPTACPTACVEYSPRFTVSARRLAATQPIMHAFANEADLLRGIEARLGAPVTIRSYGPTANDKKEGP